MKSLKSLPQPDQYGNYWFNSKDDLREDAPVIFPFSDDDLTGNWYVSLGKEGMVWERTKEGELQLRRYNSPERALRELREKLNNL